MKGGELNMSQQFLDEDYKEPITSRYMKFEEGENKFRILPAKKDKQTLIMGWEWWKTAPDGKRYPCRVNKDQTIPIGEMEVNPKTQELDTPKFFWAFAVWNYKAEAVQILELKQKTIRAAIESLSKNAKWGTPVDYDLNVTQKVEGGKTSYTVTPDPKEKIGSGILEQYELLPVNLEALYGKPGQDPFSSNEILESGLMSESIEPNEVSVD